MNVQVLLFGKTDELIISTHFCTHWCEFYQWWECSYIKQTDEAYDVYYGL